MEENSTLVGGRELKLSGSDVSGDFVDLQGEQFYRIRNCDHMDPFFMTVVSDSNHWLFVSSNGALTCGRRNPESALFPYYTDDRIQNSQDETGPKTILLLERDSAWHLWEPFSERYAGLYDGLYHAYNLMGVDADGGISIRYLDEMLEGQVAVLSSGKLDARESLDLLQALRASSLYREDQHSYILYPNRKLTAFMQKNCIPDITETDPRIASKDCNGVFHFNPAFRNATLLEQKLQEMGLDDEEKNRWLALYEEVFDHQSFTGRSGTFFKYEGLGSIYWHMVSKLLLAVQEICIREKESDLIEPLTACYYDIRQGIGAYKSVQEQGAFPTDPYSHTPAMMGAQQPGLTGQVKEDFITRLLELGVRVENGCLGFDPFLSTEDNVGFSVCTVPVTIRKGSTGSIVIERANGEKTIIEGNVLNATLSREVFDRAGTIKELRVTVRQ